MEKREAKLIVIGIDPGLTGALALYASEHGLIEVIDMPVLEVVINGKKRKRLDIAGLRLGADHRGDVVPGRSEQRFEQQRDSIRTAIATAMEAGGIKKVEHAIGTVSLKTVPPKAIITNEADIPARFWRPSDPKLDKRAVLDALKSSEAVPGAELSNGSMTIQIKVQ